eukprot:7907686-Pyramimonas_sp.AAC.1
MVTSKGMHSLSSAWFNKVNTNYDWIAFKRIPSKTNQYLHLQNFSHLGRSAGAPTLTRYVRQRFSNVRGGDQTDNG